MSGRETRDRQVMTLLVQLFGRDVMDRLAGAGFDAPAAMARAGAEKLAAEAGIPIAIARRVAIVVEESPGPAPATPQGSAARTAPAPAPQPEPTARKEPGARPEPAARSKPVERDESEMLMESASLSEPTVREERRPAKPIARKRSEPYIAAEPIKPSTPAVPPPAEPATPPAPASSVAPPSSTASTGRGTFLDDGDPFVDDVALVSWMGLSSHQPDGRLAFTVSDTILDPAEGDGNATAEREGAEPVKPERPRPPSAAPAEPPARPSTISGSFWTFGRPADSTPSPSSRKPESQPPAATPRRRKHDGH